MAGRFSQKDINDFSVLIDGSPQIVLFAINLHEYFINEKCVSIALVIFLQTTSVFRSELVAP